MLRTAYSQILNSSRDFSTAVFDGEGRLAAQAEHVPIHVGALPWAVKAVAEYFKGRIRPGDMYLLNDPYHGGNHLPDLTALLPVFVGERLAFWSINHAHQSDIGGATHSAYNPARPRSGRKASASPGSSSTTRASSATTSGHDRHQRPPPARLPGRPPHDGVGAWASAGSSSDRRLRRETAGRRRGPRQPSARAAPSGHGRTAYTAALHPRRRRAGIENVGPTPK